MMNQKLLKVLKNTLFLSIGVVLVWFSFSNSDLTFSEFIKGAKSMNYGYFVISAAFAMISHYSRALRWKLLINSTGHNPKTKNVFASVLFMYASNIAIPRSGEIARCGTLYKYEGIPIPKLLGTVFVERAIDLLTLLLLTGLLLIIQFDVFRDLYNKPSLQEEIVKILNNKSLILIIITSVVAFLGVLYFLRAKIFALGPMKKIKKLLIDLKSSLIQVFKMKKKLLFLFHTIIIWSGYVGMFYICFFAYAATSVFELADGFTAFIAGSFGMVAPTNGGVGAWQFMVETALEILVPIEPENSYAIWANFTFAVMTFTIIIAGIISFFMLPLMNKNRKVSIEVKN